jgi:hypothetical protein
MPTTTAGVLKGILALATTNAMARFMLDAMLDGMAKVLIALVLVVDSGFSG